MDISDMTKETTSGKKIQDLNVWW